MSLTPFDAKDQVRQAIDIVDLAGQYLQLRREGRIYKALCPWHDDTRPSLQINPQRQSFKCWVCNIGGDIFSFMMKIENVDFPEALSMLAERAGISLRPQRPATRGPIDATGSTQTPPASPDDKRALYRAMAWAEEQYHRCLTESPEAQPARRYLDERGISDETIAKYHLGFSPSAWDWIISRAANDSHAREAGITPRILERIGLVVPRQTGGGYYDRFRGRVLFSIRDSQGRPVAFGGRVLPEFAADNPAKYINSPETPLFSKSKMLYGLDTAREAIGRCHTAVVMEGYTDVLIARQFGVANSVAVLGTALGERHIQLLRRHYADTIQLVLDGDEAGQKRTNEILELFIAEQVDLRICTLPDELDPCDFLLHRGAADFETRLTAATDALEHAYRVATRGINVRQQSHEATRAIDSLLQTIAKAPRLTASNTSDNLIREATILARLARMFEVQEEVLRRRLGDLRRVQARPKLRGDNFVQVEPLQLTGWERELLEVVILEPESVAAIAEEIAPASLLTPHVKHIFGRCCELAAGGVTPDFERLMLDLDDWQLKSLLVDVDEQARAKNTPDAVGRLRELIAWHRRREQDQTSQAQARSLREEKLSDDDALRVLQSVIEQERNRQGISAPTEG